MSEVKDRAAAESKRKQAQRTRAKEVEEERKQKERGKEKEAEQEAEQEAATAQRLAEELKRKAAEEAKRTAARERQRAARLRSEARKNQTCQFCGAHGHQFESKQSCENYCNYCDVVGHPPSTCEAKERDEKRRRCINKDASDYKQAIEETMVFHTCAICEAEHGLGHMTALKDAADKIAASEILRLHAALLSPLGDPNADQYARSFAQAASVELVDGLLVGAKHICRQCMSELSDKKFASTTPGGLHRAPKRALVNGYFRGKVPAELAGLNRVEISLLALINVQTTITMLPFSCNYSSRATAFSVMNDVADIAETVPRKAEMAIIRTDNSASPKSFRYNPRKVLAAMVWLQQNNPLYAGKLQLPLQPDGTLEPEWRENGIDASLELPHISAVASDYDGIPQPSDDGHAVNSGAPASDITDVMLQRAAADRSHSEQVAALLVRRRTAVMTRKRGEFVPDYDTERFLAQAFPQLFPYGRGCPNIIGDVVFDAAYIQHTLQLGRYRSFQQCHSYIFYAYTWWIRRKVGTISFLVDKAGGADNAVLTVADAQKFLAALTTAPASQVEDYMARSDVRYLLDRMKPYAEELPGTEMFFARERQKLLASISSPVTTTDGQWAWFFTEAQPDAYLAEIYDNAVTSAIDEETGLPYLAWDASIEERQARSDQLSKLQRQIILRDHPFMSARMHSLQQAAFWKHVLGGEDKPLGKILDYWCRVEFQMKGTPHWHCLINVSKESLAGINANSVTSDDVREQGKVKELVAAVSTAMLLQRDAGDTSDLPYNETREQVLMDETAWMYNIDRRTYLADTTHPSRHRFTAAGRDYFMSRAGHITDPYVRRLYRRLQFANQFHVCQKSCFKYCKKHGEQKCRFDFPRTRQDGIEDGAVIVKDMDRRRRCRVKVHPQRNNGNMNNHLRSPLCFLSGRGNQDIQYIHNTVGGAEYVSKYCSKAEKTESTALQNAINRKLAEHAIRCNSETGANMSFLQKLRAVGNAVAGAQQVGATEATYVLGKMPLVKSSRVTINVNVLKRKELDSHAIVTDESELAQMQGDESALVVSPSTLLGTRDAYHALSQQQISEYESMEVTFFAFLSAYRTRAAPPTGLANARNGPPRLSVNEHGFVNNPKSFIFGEVLYSAMARSAVLCLVPHIPVEEDNERFAYATLLLYGKWPEEGESHLAVPNAVAALAAAKPMLPAYVLTSLDKRKRSDALLANTGEPHQDDYLHGEPDGDGTSDRAEFDALQREREFDSITAAPFTADMQRFTYSAELAKIKGCREFIENLKDTMSASRQPRSYTLTDEEMARRAADPQLFIPLHNADGKEVELQEMASSLNIEQRRAFDAAGDHISGVSGKQMIMFVSGEGGTGKSRLIHAVALHAQLYVGKTEGSWGPVLKTAPTGGAAYNIGGSTWHSALSRGGKAGLKINDPVPDAAVAALQRKAKGTTLFVLDELSLVSAEDLFEISRRLQAATGNADQLFGGLHVLLAGDFYQMKTVQGTSLVSSISACISHEARRGRQILLTGLTDFCLLKQNVRAQQGNGELSQLARFTREARLGNVHNGILLLMNDRIVNDIDVAMRQAHPNAIWITSTHEKVANINREFRKRRLQNNERMITIIAEHTPEKVGTGIPSPNTRQILNELYGTLGSVKGGRSELMVTHMRLFVGSRVRLIRNLYVEAGLYNGAMGTVWGFVYKGAAPLQGAEGRRLFCDMTEDERELPIVLVQMDGDESSHPYTCIPGVPRVVPVLAEKSQQLVEAKVVTKPAVMEAGKVILPAVTQVFKYRRHQLPILPAEARTAHSVQGYTAKDGVVVDPGSTFFAGDYTAVSRATTKEKVFLLGALKESGFTRDPGYRYLVEKEYERLLAAFPQ